MLSLRRVLEGQVPELLLQTAQALVLARRPISTGGNNGVYSVGDTVLTSVYARTLYRPQSGTMRVPLQLSKL